jgi:ABC-type branched-subunit amino acid transport system substrate-binding protein
MNLFSSILILCSVVSALSVPASVTLGGLFPAFRSGATAVTAATINGGQRRQAAFLMAVKEINKSPFILPNTTIKISVRDSKLDVGVSFLKALELATTANSNQGVDGCIGGATSSEAEAEATVFKQFSKTMVSFSATSPSLSSKLNYPTFARTCPSDAFQGSAMAEIVGQYYGW